MCTGYTQEDFERELSEATPGVPFKTMHGGTVGRITRWFAHLPLFAGHHPIHIVGLYNIKSKKRRYAAEFGTVHTNLVSLESECLPRLFKDILIEVFLREPTLTPASLVLPCAAEWFREVAYDALDSLRTTLQARFPYASPEAKFLADLEATGLHGWRLCKNTPPQRASCLTGILRLGDGPSLLVGHTSADAYKVWLKYGFASTSSASDCQLSKTTYTNGILQCLRVVATRRNDLLSLPKLPGVFGQWHRTAMLKCQENLESEKANLQDHLEETQTKLLNLEPRLNGLTEHVAMYSNEDERQ